MIGRASLSVVVDKIITFFILNSKIKCKTLNLTIQMLIDDHKVSVEM